mmetsp:Transcript_7440/g.11967  ORF Transcript_7440/g.11967 Transcript_7440/m.11967 type:complete len:155 (+) Transcript_7440:357-821(+)|eukprot:CAMPEP_0203783260 /NCGR_PEP_ID=MMETSP0099_2-20121227/11577_1 /ASSEMBLY_ACC=CAM_ASM_000209 /TAXON_ID=96639 /ORGANISM=" , Strain NY0313808BC1" /LENGTH=154 /DNA_ID=CAMNT_0050685107 /DNA_START=185 /DNA_END=649 /DNA_ORIENTATION=+
MACRVECVGKADEKRYVEIDAIIANDFTGIDEEYGVYSTIGLRPNSNGKVLKLLELKPIRGDCHKMVWSCDSSRRFVVGFNDEILIQIKSIRMNRRDLVFGTAVISSLGTHLDEWVPAFNSSGDKCGQVRVRVKSPEEPRKNFENDKINTLGYY